MDIAKRVDKVYIVGDQQECEMLAKRDWKTGGRTGYVYNLNRYEVRICLRGHALTVGVTSSEAIAARFADAAKVYFWPYRTQRQRVLCGESFNFSLDEAQHMLDNNGQILALLECLRALFVKRGIIPAEPSGDMSTDVAVAHVKAWRAETERLKQVYKKLLRMKLDDLAFNVLLDNIRESMHLFDDMERLAKHTLEALGRASLAGPGATADALAMKEQHLENIQRELEFKQKLLDEQQRGIEERARLLEESAARKAAEYQQHLAVCAAEGKEPVDLFSPEAIKNLTAAINAKTEAENKRLDSLAKPATLPTE